MLHVSAFCIALSHLWQASSATSSFLDQMRGSEHSPAVGILAWFCACIGRPYCLKVVLQCPLQLHSG